MRILIWSLVGLYLFGFGTVLVLGLNIGPVTPGLALLRAIVWPLYVTTGRPRGERLPMD